MPSPSDPDLHGNPEAEREDDRRRRRPDGSPMLDLAARFVRAGAEAVVTTSERIRERGEDLPKDLVMGAAQLTARGKDEIMTIVAQEVRTWLDKLEVAQSVRKLMTEHTLEVSASFRLRPIDPAPSGAPAPANPAAPAEAKRA